MFRIALEIQCLPYARLNFFFLVCYYIFFNFFYMFFTCCETAPATQGLLIRRLGIYLVEWKKLCFAGLFVGQLLSCLSDWLGS